MSNITNNEHSKQLHRNTAIDLTLQQCTEPHIYTHLNLIYFQVYTHVLLTCTHHNGIGITQPVFPVIHYHSTTYHPWKDLTSKRYMWAKRLCVLSFLTSYMSTIMSLIANSRNAQPQKHHKIFPCTTSHCNALHI